MQRIKRMENWKIEAERLKIDQGKSWSQVATELQHYFPDKTFEQAKDKIRIYIQRLPRFRETKDLYLEPSEPQIITNKWTGDKIIRFGLMGDTQINSKYTQLTHLHKLYDIYQQEGIDTVYHTGDIDEGEEMRMGHKYECYTQGADDHIDEIVNIYPKRKGTTTHFITGNHDHSIFKRVGFDIGPVIASRRDDMKYLGRDQAIIRLTPNCDLEIRHPGDGTAYALSYKTQKQIEAMSGGEKPHIYAVGHYHKADYMFYRNVHAFQTGCFQSDTPFTRSKGISIHMGGWIIEANVDEEGTITRLKQEFIPFYKAIKEDWKNWR
jgi:hypothetical protein